MPKKLSFRVVFWSGADEDYPARDLEVHSPLAKGWRSSRYCIYPQEIILQLPDQVRMRKIQILAHQYLIATKIEIYIGQIPPNLPCTLQNAQFQRLGYISLSDNQKTGFKARELKSVHIDAAGQFLKLVLGKNHVNRHNVFNQVGIVAINVIADDPSRERADLPPHFSHYAAEESLTNILHSYLPSSNAGNQPVNPDPLLWGKVNRADVPPMDDLMFDMYIDPETAKLIRQLEVKKTEAVQGERYDYAKKLKQAIADLRKVGERLARYEVEKQRAVEKEDYDTAQLKKIQSDEFRLHVYQQLDLNDLLELRESRPHHHHHHHEPTQMSIARSPVFARQDLQKTPSPMPPPPRSSPRLTLAQTVDEDRAFQREEDQPKFYEPAIADDNADDHSPVVAAAKFDSNDERPLPALSKRPHGDIIDESESPKKDFGVAEPLTDKASREASGPIDVFGMEIVKNLYSKVYAHREEGLSGIDAHLIHRDGQHDKTDVMRATVFILRRTLADHVHPVWQRSLDVLRTLLTSYAKKHKLSKESAGFIIDKTLPLVLAKGVETAPRTREMAKKFVRDMAQFPLVKSLNVIGPLCVEPVKLQSPWRLFASRIELVELLIDELGIGGKSGLAIGSIMKFLLPGLEHTKKEVRELALRLILKLYKTEEYKTGIRSHLPELTEDLKKKTLWRGLFKEFDVIDGKETEEDKQAALRVEEKKKKAEVDRLKAQLAALKDIAAGKVSTGDVDLSALGIDVDAESAEAAVQKPKGITAKAERKRKESRPPPSEVSSARECVFCGEKNDSFDEAGLEKHFVSDCPMLQRCAHCNQVVEIAMLRDHWVTECEAKGNFKECETCKKAILTSEYEQHVSEKGCESPRDGSVYCPLCHNSLQSTDEKWRAHLLACKKNPRRKAPKRLAAGKTGIPAPRGGGGRTAAKGVSKLPQFKKK